MNWEFIALFLVAGEGAKELRGIVHADNASIAEDKVYDMLPENAQEIQIYASSTIG